MEIRDPRERLRTALGELYGFYARTELMRANVLRDAESMPELAALLEASVVPYLDAVRDLLAEGWKVGDGRRARLLATLKLAIDFHTWRSLERGSECSTALPSRKRTKCMWACVRAQIEHRTNPASNPPAPTADAHLLYGDASSVESGLERQCSRSFITNLRCGTIAHKGHLLWPVTVWFPKKGVFSA